MAVIAATEGEGQRRPDRAGTGASVWHHRDGATLSRSLQESNAAP